MVTVTNKGQTSEYVYDISLDGTVVNALGCNTGRNTDGFNFKIPDNQQLRYTPSHPYIGKGLGRNTVEGKEYVGVEADVAEFEDMHMNRAYNGGVNKMGLGIDEYCDATINFSRKNYADLLPGGKMKKVGNTIKSRKMAGYLERFIDDGVNLLLHNNGAQFLRSYYDYVERIYNYRVPLKEIASKGKIKKTVAEYISDCATLTKAGTKKSRQAWYELVIRDRVKVSVSDSVYYINTGKKKAHSDVKRVTHQFVRGEDGSEVELTTSMKTQLFKGALQGLGLEKVKDLSNQQKKDIIASHVIREEDEIVLNCKRVPNEIIDDERDILCCDVEGMEYNAEKYIDQFNSRIKPLLVCFSPEIRDKILITNPDDRKFFTEEESKLVSGYPNKETDQDTYEALMTPEPKEIAFWLSIGERPPFVDECGIDWDGLVEKYKEQKKQEDDMLFRQEDAKYMDALSKLTKKDYDAFEEDGIIPASIDAIVTMDSDMRFYFKRIPHMTPSTGGNVFDDLSYDGIDNTPDE